MIGTYVKHPVYGVGKVIKISSISELVFFFEANKELHDGAIEPRSCPGNHGWWFSFDDIKIKLEMNTISLSRRTSERM